MLNFRIMPSPPRRSVCVRRKLLTTLFAMPFVTGPVFATDGAERLEYVNKLIESSTISRRVLDSQNALAGPLLEEARSLYRQAESAFEKGEIQDMENLLGEAVKAMMKAGKATADSSRAAERSEAGLKQRLRSVESLKEAYLRILAEKKPQEPLGISPDIDQGMEAASQLVEAGKVEEARILLDVLYGRIIAEVESLRRGETLVRTLTFANAEEEYLYELDRNDTHQMLLQVLLKGKTRSASADKFVDDAARLRRSAEDRADEGDHEGAISALEESTRNFIRAIRSAGIYIPG